MSVEGNFSRNNRPLFARHKGRGFESGLHRALKNTKMSAWRYFRILKNRQLSQQ